VYEFKYIRDLAQKNNPYVSDMVLVLGENKSHYCSAQLYNSAVENGVLKKFSQPVNPLGAASASSVKVVSGGAIMSVGKYGVLIKEEIMKDLQKKKLEVNARVSSRDYVIDNDLPEIKWELHNDTKLIGQYKCQMATGTYGGRQYEVWFTPDLAFNDGPWKLNGLPGLILEAHDSKNEIIFTFKEIAKGPETAVISTSFIKSERSIPTSLKNYKQLRAAFDSDPEGITLAGNPNAKIYIHSVDSSEAKVTKIKKYNQMEVD
jgi:GLPGLI family protein